VLKNCSCHKTQLRDQLRIHLLRNPPPAAPSPTKNANHKLWQSMHSLRFPLLLLLQIPVESLNR
jgi:hypothetical protein